MRFDLLTGEWVNIVGHRQSRPESSPRRLPVLRRRARSARSVRRAVVRQPLARTRARAPRRRLPGRTAAAGPVGARRRCVRSGACSRRNTASRSRACRVEQVRKVVDLWAERTTALLARPEIEYVLVFENRGREVGATIDHPHGQIYGYPFVPPRPPARCGTPTAAPRCAARSRSELACGASAIVAQHGDWVAWVPFASGYTYGMRFAPRAPHRIAARARRHVARRSRRAPRRRARPLRPALAGDRARPTVSVSPVVPPGAGRPAVTDGTCTRTSRRRCARPAYPATSRRVSSEAARLSNPVVPEDSGAGVARCLTARHFAAPGPRQPDRRPGRLPRRLGRLDGDRPRRRGRRAARDRTDAGRSRAPTGISTASSTSRPTASDDPAPCDPPWGRARSAASSRVLAELGRARVGADLDDHVDRADRRRLVVERGVRGRGRARAERRRRLRSSPARELALAAQHAEHVATGVPCGTQDQLASVFGQRRSRAADRLPHPRDRSTARSPTLRVLVVHSGVPAHARGNALRAAAGREHRSRGLDSALRALRDATLEQVRDEPRGRHAVTEMAACARSPTRCAPATIARARAARCSRATRRRATTWRCRRPSSTRSSSASSTPARSAPDSPAPDSAAASSRSCPPNCRRDRGRRATRAYRADRPRTDVVGRAGRAGRGA